MVDIDYLKEVKTRGLDDFQISEVTEGLKKLTVEQVDIYAWPKYDHMQMQEIRLALEEGLSEEEMSVFLDPSIDWKAMNHARVKLQNANAVDDRAKAKLHFKRLQIIFIAILIVLCLGAAGFGGYYAWQYFSDVNQSLELELTDTDITVEYGSSFNPADYISSYTKADNVILDVPEAPDTHTKGTVTIMYQLHNAYKSITKELAINVVDSKAPVITLNAQEDTLVRGKDTFSCKAYLTSAEDGADGDLTGNVTCSEADESKDDQMITYSVKDSSGNEGKAEFSLHYEDPAPPPEPVVIYQPVSTGGSSNSSSGSSYQGGSSGSSSSGGVSPPSQTQSHGTQYFMFSSGYDMDSGYQACIVAGSAYGAYSCSPIMEGGIYTGYVLTY